MTDKPLNLTDQQILYAAAQLGATGGARVVGICYEVSLDLLRRPFSGAGGEYVRFIGIDTVTGERVVANYAGVAAGVGASLIPNTNVGGGAFSF